MSPEHYAWGSLRRTGRQFGLVALVTGVAFLVLVVLILALGVE